MQISPYRAGNGLSEQTQLTRWMMFVDGENYTIRAQNYAESLGLQMHLIEGDTYMRDVFLWFRDHHPWYPLLYNTPSSVFNVRPIRCHYYTSITGDDGKLDEVRRKLWNLGFNPAVFKKEKKAAKAKGVDIALTKDMLSHAFLNNYDIATIVAGDGDYIPLVEEVQRLGKLVCVAFFDTDGGLNPQLRLTADVYFDLSEPFRRLQLLQTPSV